MPEKIIIYRDGVSDGDLKHVEEVELHDLKQSFKSYPGSYCPMVTCIIVQKRINSRVFQVIWLDVEHSVLAVNLYKKTLDPKLRPKIIIYKQFF